MSFDAIILLYFGCHHSFHSLVLLGIYCPLKERVEEERRKEGVKARTDIVYWQNIFWSLPV